MYESIKRSLSLLRSVAGREIYLVFAMMIVISLFEMLSIGLIVPVIQAAILSGADLSKRSVVPILSEYFVEKNYLAAISIMFCSVFIIKNFLILAIVHLTNRKIFKYSAIAKERLFRSYIEKDLSFHATTNSGRMLQNIIISTGHSFEAARQVLMIFLEFMLASAAITLLLIVEPVVSLAVVTCLVGTSLVFFSVASPRFRFWGQQMLMIETEQIKWIKQILENVPFTKITGKQREFSRVLGNMAQDRARYESLSATSLQMPKLFLETIAVLSLVGVVGTLMYLDRSSANLIATMGVFGMAALRLLPSLNRLVSAASEVRRRSAFIDEIYEDLLWEPARSGPEQSKQPSITFNHSLDLCGISYTYGNGRAAALENTTLSIAKGEAIGIVGSSGAGKSTLANIILGLIFPDQGTIKVDGVALGDRIENWHQLVGYVPQETYLFDDTLERNITFADNVAVDQRLAEVIKIARLDDVLRSLPDGVRSMIGEHGAQLSGGQRQRIAIARALYRNPEVIVFDEATSALDNESESEVSRAIQHLSGKKTLLIIAHRLSTIRHCDRIVFMENGRIREIGTFDELRERCGPFREMVDLGNLKVG